MKIRATTPLFLIPGLAAVLSACGGGAGTPQGAASPAPTLLATTVSSAAPTDVYVSPGGLDTNAGTATAPVQTIGRASQLAGAGTTVHVAAGTYAGGFQTLSSGTASARLRYVAATPGKVRIVPQAVGGGAAAWDNRGSYVDIVGFEIDGSVLTAGTRWTTGIYTAGANDLIQNNHVHHIANTGTCASGGGIGADSYYKGTNNDVFANTIHDIGVAGCSTMYGMYVNTPDSDIKNNLVYAISDAAIQLWHDATRVKVVNNTLFNANIGVLVGGGNYYTTSGPNDYTVVSNNIIVDNRYGVVEKGATGVHNVYRNNVMYQNAMLDFQLANGLTAVSTVSAAPAFVNYVRTGGGDYHLNTGSPAIGRAYALDAPATDLAGQARPTNGSYDVGVYQYQASLAAPAPSFGATTTYHLYVAPTGLDTNPGTSSAPLKTIARAAALAKPDTTVHVAPGTYAGGFKTTVSGTATGRIYFVSTQKWGARIVPPLNSTTDTAWDNRGSYVEINGFEIDGTVAQGGTVWRHGIYNGGSYDAIRNNHVHHIAKSITCTSAGGSAIGVDSYYHGVATDVINNVVHDIGATSCSYIQGIYMSTSGSVQSNLVYRVGEAGIHLWHDAHNVLIANNTVTSSDIGIIVGGGDFYYSTTGDDYTQVINNIVYDNRYGISEQGTTGIHNVYANNLVYQNSGYNYSLKNGLTAKSSVQADPQFTSYSRTGSSDYHLKSTSPAIGVGSTSLAPLTDIDGYARSPMGIGAYQFR